MQVTSVWRERLEAPLRDVLSVSDRTAPDAAATATAFQCALEAALMDAIMPPAVTSTPISDAAWEAAVKRLVSFLGHTLFDGDSDAVHAPHQGDDHAESRLSPRQCLAQQTAQHTKTDAAVARAAAQQVEMGFVWLASRLHLTVTASSSGFLALCAPEKKAARDEEAEAAAYDSPFGNSSGGLLDDDNPLAAPTPTIPDGVRLAVIAVARAILSLQRARTHGRDVGSPALAVAAPLLPNLRWPTAEVWFSFVLHFLQQLSANGADAKGLWATFLTDCRDELAKRAAESRRRQASTAAAKPPAVATTTAAAAGAVTDIEPVALWATTFTPTLLAETVSRTRFRRAAQLFRSNAPHLLEQAPHTAFLVFDVITQFAREWTTVLENDIPLGQLSEAAQKLFSTSLFDLTSTSQSSHENGASDPSADARRVAGLSPTERALHELIKTTAARLNWLLGESGLHLHLVATLIGSALCVLYVQPSIKQRASSANGGGQNDDRTASTSGTSKGTTASAGGKMPPPPVHVVGRRATTSRSALTNSAFESLLTNQASGPVPIPVGESTSVADTLLRRHGALSMDGLVALEAQSWLAPRPISAAPAAHYLCTDSEWRVRQFAPIGLVLKRVGLFAFLPPHLFYWSTQLKLGTSNAQQRDGRQRTAMAAFLSGVCNAQVALAMFHYASQPSAQSSPTTPAAASAAASPQQSPVPSAPSTLSPVYAALRSFTLAMESFVCKAEMERVVDVTGGSAGSGVGVLQESRKRPRRGRRGRDDGEAEAVALADEAAYMPSFRNGELAGERFTRMVYPEPMPQWSQFLSQASSYALPATAQTGTVATPGAQGRNSTVLAPECVAPLHFLLELLAARYFGLSTALIEFWWRQPESVNVFLVPRAALPVKDVAASVNAQLFLTLTTLRWFDHWQQEQLVERGDACSDHDTEVLVLATQERILRHELLPMWRLAHTFCTRVDVLKPLLTHCTRMTTRALHLLDDGNTDTNTKTTANEEETTTTAVSSLEPDPFAQRARPRSSSTALVRRVLATTEMYVMQVIMPCLRVMPPSPIMYDALESLFDVFGQCNWRVRYGEDAVRPLHINAWCAYLLAPLPNTPARMHDIAVSNAARHCRRYPHDLLESKERHALFVQSLKRMNAHTVDYYRRLLRPVLYADPLFVVERLLSQAVGYENNFLTLHTRLLNDVPTPILTLLVHRGLALMHDYVAKERLDATAGSNRVGLVAAFLCSVWSANTARVDGGLLLRAAELALRGETRHDTVMGLELLKAIFYQLLHRTLEHEEQFNDVQCMALATATTTRLFARGQMESFRVGRWSTWMTPMRRQNGDAALRSALAQQCEVPVEDANDDAERDEDVENGTQDVHGHPSGSVSGTQKVLRLTLGQHLLLHLARRQARIYALQADLDGTMDTILATSSRDYNTITDLLFALQELLPDGPPESLLRQVALPHVAMLLSGKSRLKHCHALTHPHHHGAAATPGNASHALTVLEANVLEVPPIAAPPPASTVQSYLSAQDAAWRTAAEAEAKSTSSDVVSSPSNSLLSYALLRDLSYFSAVHLCFDPAPYDAALREMTMCRHKIDHIRAVRAADDDLAGDMDDWLDGQQWQQQLEKAAHERTYQASAAAREALRMTLEKDVFSSPEATYVLGISHLLPRALLSLEEASFVIELLRWLLNHYIPAVAHDDAATATSEPHAPQNRLYAERVMDMMYAITTQAATLFVGLTDGEAKRYGYLLHRLVRLLQEVEVRVCGGTPPAGLFHALPPVAAAVVKAEEKRLVAAAAAAAVSAAETAGEVSGSAATAAGQSGGATQGRAAVQGLTADDMAAAFDLPGALTDATTTTTAAAGAASSAAVPLLWDTLVETSSASPNSDPTTSEDAQAVDAAAEAASQRTPASLLQLEAFLLRFLTSVLLDQENVPSHLHRHVFLILERVDKRIFPTTRVGADLLLRAVKRHSQETNPNFASATAVLKGLRDGIRQKNGLLNTAQRYTEQSLLTTASSALPAKHNAPIEAVVNGATVTVTPAEAAVAMQDWMCQWRLRETYLGQLLAREMQAAGISGGATHGDEDDDDDDNVEDNDQREGKEAAEAAVDAAIVEAHNDDDDDEDDDDEDEDKILNNEEASSAEDMDEGGSDGSSSVDSHEDDASSGDEHRSDVNEDEDDEEQSSDDGDRVVQRRRLA